MSSDSDNWQEDETWCEIPWDKLKETLAPKGR